MDQHSGWDRVFLSVLKVDAEARFRHEPDEGAHVLVPLQVLPQGQIDDFVLQLRAAEENVCGVAALARGWCGGGGCTCCRGSGRAVVIFLLHASVLPELSRPAASRTVPVAAASLVVVVAVEVAGCEVLAGLAAQASHLAMLCFKWFFIKSSWSLALFAEVQWGQQLWSDLEPFHRTTVPVSSFASWSSSR